MLLLNLILLLILCSNCFELRSISGFYTSCGVIVWVSHTREQQRAKRFGGKESGEEAPRKWDCFDLCNFSISDLPEWGEIPLDKKQEKQENCQAIMVDKEHLDPYRVSNLPHVLAINNKSSTLIL